MLAKLLDFNCHSNIIINKHVKQTNTSQSTHPSACQHWSINPSTNLSTMANQPAISLSTLANKPEPVRQPVNNGQSTCPSTCQHWPINPSINLSTLANRLLNKAQIEFVEIFIVKCQFEYYISIISTVTDSVA
jgi:hypothetical protein